jgi:tartrate/fumarate subfamily iron-sulfur-dependent hydro-lyase beta chain
VIHRVALPVPQESVAEWRAGDVVFLSGILLTARDLAHRRILDAAEEGRGLPFDPTGLPIFHCGPLARRDGERWTITGLGPTTSARMESSTPAVMERYRTPFLIGKGGMGPATRQAIVKHRAAYLAAVGGTGALGARAVESVLGVYWLEEVGMPDAVCILRVHEYGPLVVTIDSTGRDLHDEVARAAA